LKRSRPPARFVPTRPEAGPWTFDFNGKAATAVAAATIDSIRDPEGVPLMRLNHLNLTVPDVPGSRKFFETYFGLKSFDGGGRDGFALLVDESGFVLTLNNFEKATEVSYPGAFHIGFHQESRERVDEIHQRLKADGFDVKTPKEFHGAWTFYFRAPGGFLVEVFHQETAGPR
jgi:catechol 2,3-dioxygenase-like lactoylglutathione lyase family enzyme